MDYNCLTSVASTRSVARICLLEEGRALGTALPSLLEKGSGERNLLGATVVRGPKWKFSDDDGGAGNRGRIVAAKMRQDTEKGTDEFEVQVQWAGCKFPEAQYSCNRSCTAEYDGAVCVAERARGTLAGVCGGNN